MSNSRRALPKRIGNYAERNLLISGEYDWLLSAYRDLPLRILQIGVQDGEELEGYGAYFGNASSILGCSTDTVFVGEKFQTSNITILVGDVNSNKTYRNIVDFVERVDLVVDDGTRLDNEIIYSFSRYFPLLSDGGIYFIGGGGYCHSEDAKRTNRNPDAVVSFFQELLQILGCDEVSEENARGEMLKSFNDRHGVLLDHACMASIHSVHFHKSACLIRKKPSSIKVRTEDERPRDDRSVHEWRSRAAEAGVGRPEDDGATVDRRSPFRARADGGASERNVRQVDVNGQDLAHHAGKVKKLEREVASYRAELLALYGSRSWRLTAPLRYVVNIVRRARAYIERPLKAVRDRGGVVSVIIKVRRLYSERGYAGVKQHLQRILSTDGERWFAGVNGYEEWVKRYDTLDDRQRELMKSNIQKMDSPLISVLMPVYNPEPAWLAAAIESVKNQVYPNWELCIADDASTDPRVKRLLNQCAESDDRIKVVYREQNGHISEASNSALAVATGKWIALLDHDDLLAATALYWVVEEINTHQDTYVIYSDEDKIDVEGNRFDPHFKCDWNRMLFYSYNMVSHLGVYRTQLVRRLGGFRQGFEGAQDYDLALRCIEVIDPRCIRHIPRILYHWRVHEQSTATNLDAKPYAQIAGQRALAEHFQRVGVSAEVFSITPGYRVVFGLPEILPKVSLIIPTRNGVELLRQCIESIVHQTTYPNYEVIVVDNGSDEPATLQYMESLNENPKIRVLRDDRPFNYSALNNAAVRAATGDVIGLINNDIEVLAPEWLTEMVSMVVHPDVGVVGARLWYPDDTLQHGGVVLGIRGVAGHAHKCFRRSSYGYFSRAVIAQEFSAVTGACLLVRKAVYEEVGGLNERHLAVAFNDVDFCLKVREAGYRNIWTPYAELYHHESASRGLEDSEEKRARFAAEVAYMLNTWSSQLVSDPAYSPNLTLEHEDFGLAWPPRVKALTEWGA